MDLHVLVTVLKKFFHSSCLSSSLENFSHSLSWPCIIGVEGDKNRKNIIQKVKLQLKSNHLESDLLGELGMCYHHIKS